MIQKIGITGLKSIDTLELNCKNLTILCGTNSSGKSTVLQALFVVSKNLDGLLFLGENEKQEHPQFEKIKKNNREIIIAGGFREVKNFNSASLKIRIVIIDENGFDVEFAEDENGPFIRYGDKTKIHDSMKYGNKLFHFLSCNRIGHQDTYSKNLTNQDLIGLNGEYAMHYLQQHNKENLDECLLKNDNNTLEAQVNYWLKYIIGAEVETEYVTGTDILKATYSLVEGKKSRPNNVGSGIGYIVSVIILCLAAKKDSIIVIENPEIHLHPSAQSRVCEFLYFVANAGRQIFVETHSDHIFNGIRAGIASNSMDKEKISFNYLSLNKKNCTENTEIIFGKNGNIENQKAGLFDQFDIDLNKMLGL